MFVFLVIIWPMRGPAVLTNERWPGDVGNDDTVSPEVDIRGLAVVGEVLDVDGLLVQDEDVSGDGVRGPVEGAEV